jgi:hypothetical protein
LQCRALFETDASQCDANAECPSGFPVCSAEHVCVRAPSGGAGGQAAGGRASSGGSLNAGGGSDNGGTLNELGGEAGGGAGGELVGAAGAKGGGTSGVSRGGASAAGGSIAVAGEAGGPVAGAGGEPSSNPTVGPGSVDAVLGVMDADVDDASAWLGRTVYASGTWNDSGNVDSRQSNPEGYIAPFINQWALNNSTSKQIKQNGGLLLNLTSGLFKRAFGQSWVGAASDQKIGMQWDDGLGHMHENWMPQGDATLYVAFAREFNGGSEYIDWDVDLDTTQEIDGFKEAWGAFTKTLRKQFEGGPRVRTVWCVEDAPNGYANVVKAFPLADTVDVVGVVLGDGASSADFATRGHSSVFDAVRDLADTNHKPIGICRWTATVPAENPEADTEAVNKTVHFVESLGQWLLANRGTTTGKVEFAIYDDAYECAKPERRSWRQCVAVHDMLSKVSSP